MNNFITNLLNLKDPNLIFLEKVELITKKDITYHLISAKLSYTPEACLHCGTINQQQIIKYGYKTSRIKLLPCNGNPMILKLDKQRFFCKHCQHTFTAKTPIVDKHCFISKQVKLNILADLKMKISEKDIATLNSVSHATVSRTIDNNYTVFVPNKHHLPEALLFDEFKSTKDAKGAMSFIFVNARTHDVIDIVENRQLPFLIHYFATFSSKARRRVKYICTDIYKPYISLIKKMFPHAQIVIDRFHIVQLLTRAFNKTRINTMKKLSTSRIEYKRLKKYWQLFLKPISELDYIHFRRFTHFNTWQSPQSVVDTALAVDDTLKNTYNALQLLLLDIKSKNKDHLLKHLAVLLDANISDEFKTAILTLLK